MARTFFVIVIGFVAFLFHFPHVQGQIDPDVLTRSDKAEILRNLNIGRASDVIDPPASDMNKLVSNWVKMKCRSFST